MKNSNKIIIKSITPFNDTRRLFLIDNKTNLENQRVTIPSDKKSDLTFSVNEKALFKHATIEKFKLHKLKTLQYYFIDVLETQNLSEKDRKWFELNLERISIILKGKVGTYFCDLEYIYILVNYQMRRNSGVGRLYARRTFSFNYLPREIRGILINDEYKNFDMVNSHPTLALEYAIFNMEISPKYLEIYVTNRDHFISTITEKFGVNKGYIKELILKTINSTSKDMDQLISNLKSSNVKSLESFLFKLHKEIVLIREHIYEHCFIKNSIFVEYLKNDKKYENKTIEKRKTTIQSLYFQSKETVYVYNLIKDLQEQVLERIKANEHNKGWHQRFINKVIDSDESEFFLTIIPMFDGVLVGSEDEVIKLALMEMVENHNKRLFNEGSLVRFAHKKLDRTSKKIDLELYNLYYDIVMFTQNMRISQVDKLVRLIGIESVSFDNLSDMGIKAKEFRRAFFKALIECQELHNIPFDKNFIREISKIYPERLKKYKKSTEFRRSLENDEYDRFDRAFKDVAGKKMESKSDEELKNSNFEAFEVFGAICEPVDEGTN